MEQVYLKVPLSFKFPCSFVTSPCRPCGHGRKPHLLVIWVQCVPVMRRCDHTHPTVSLVAATVAVKRGKVTGGEDMVTGGAGWAGKGLTACLKEQALVRRKADSVPQRNDTR